MEANTAAEYDGAGRIIITPGLCRVGAACCWLAVRASHRRRSGRCRAPKLQPQQPRYRRARTPRGALSVAK
jgi:hypothetical protein